MTRAQKITRSTTETVPLVVSDLMTREVFTMTKEDSLRALRDVFNLKRIRHVPITDENDNLVGLVTQRDFLTVAVSKFAHFDRFEIDEIYQKIQIGEIMGKKLATVDPQTPAGKAAELMFRNKYGCLPVVSGKRLVGILTEADFVRAFAEAFAKSELTYSS